MFCDFFYDRYDLNYKINEIINVSIWFEAETPR